MVVKAILSALGLSNKKPHHSYANRAQDWDVFISHASEDKESHVRPLASALDAFGLRVWYDEFSLSFGDSLSRSIDRGLARSSIGIVVLTPNFIAKKWTDYELRGLAARHINDGDVIVSVIHDLDNKAILDFCPSLLSLPNFQVDQYTSVQLASLIIQLARPETADNILVRMSRISHEGKGEVQTHSSDKLHSSPIRHGTLPASLHSQVRLIRALYLGADTQTMEFWLDGFRRDSNPSQNILEWLRNGSVLREANLVLGHLNAEQVDALAKIIIGVGAIGTIQDFPIDRLEEFAKKLPDDRILLYVASSLEEAEPQIDFDDAFPAGDSNSRTLRVPTLPLTAEGEIKTACTAIFSSADSAKLIVNLEEHFSKYSISVDKIDTTTASDIGLDFGYTSNDVAIFVISKSLLSSDIARKYLSALTNLELFGEANTSILPIWHEVNRSDVLEFSPALADRLAYDTSQLEHEKLAEAIVIGTFPHTTCGVLRRLLWRILETGPSDEVFHLPIRHEKLSSSVQERIRAIRAGLLIISPLPFKFWVDGFKRELVIDDEIILWEKVVAVFHEVISFHGVSEADQAVCIIKFCIRHLSGPDWSNVKLDEALLSTEVRSSLLRSLELQNPYLEVDGPTHTLKEHDNIAPEDNEHSLGAEMYRSLDRERFPIDLPEELVRELMSDSMPLIK